MSRIRNLSDTALFARFLSESGNGAIFSAKDTVLEKLAEAKKIGSVADIRAAKLFLRMIDGELDTRYQVSTASSIAAR